MDVWVVHQDTTWVDHGKRMVLDHTITHVTKPGRANLVGTWRVVALFRTESEAKEWVSAEVAFFEQQRRR